MTKPGERVRGQGMVRERPSNKLGEARKRVRAKAVLERPKNKREEGRNKSTRPKKKRQ
jgi:hypothetical protein